MSHRYDDQSERGRILLFLTILLILLDKRLGWIPRSQFFLRAIILGNEVVLGVFGCAEFNGAKIHACDMQLWHAARLFTVRAGMKLSSWKNKHIFWFLFCSRSWSSRYFLFVFCSRSRTRTCSRTSSRLNWSNNYFFLINHSYKTKWYLNFS